MVDAINNREQALVDAQKVIEDHKEDFNKWKAAADAAAVAGTELPAPPPSIAGAVATVGTTLGHVALGVGSTAADAVGVVGGTAQALHDNVNNFFGNLRNRLGI